MRLSPPPEPAAAQPSSVNKADKKSRATDQSGERGESSRAEKKIAAGKDAPASAVPAIAAPVIDYTRPNDTTSLLMDLQRRVIDLEAKSTRKLTAGEYAIVVEATTSIPLEKWERQGYVVEKCHCDNPMCKGWRLTPVEHHRTAAKEDVRQTGAVAVQELKDVAPTEVGVDEEWDDDDLEAILEQMFTDGLLKRGKNEATLIPPDGPMTWTHAQMLAFAHGFEMEGLKSLRGKPRELQRALIEGLRGLGYDVQNRPDVPVETKTDGKPTSKKAKRKGGS